MRGKRVEYFAVDPGLDFGFNRSSDARERVRGERAREEGTEAGGVVEVVD